MKNTNFLVTAKKILKKNIIQCQSAMWITGGDPYENLRVKKMEKKQQKKLIGMPEIAITRYLKSFKLQMTKEVRNKYQ